MADDLDIPDDNETEVVGAAQSLAPSKPIRNRISGEEWFEISRQLEDHHAVFYKVWEMGQPIFSDKIDTAAIQFDKGGDYVMFLFNPEYWDRCTPYERLFTICHEALHVILNHGVRIKDAEDRNATNAALDVVVNHLLTRSFGFDRQFIRGWDKLCWVDTVFKNPDGTLKTNKGQPIPDDDCFEYYFNLFEKVYLKKIGCKGIKGSLGKGKGQGQGGKGGDKGDEEDEQDGQGGLQTVDDHSYMDEPSDFSDVIDALDEGLSDQEKESLKGMIDKHFEAPGDSGGQPGGKMAGTGTGGQWHFANVKKVAKKKKWETVIKNWAKKYRLNTDNDQEQWARINRRFTLLPRNMFLPSEMEIETEFDEKKRIEVYFYLDTSGSCWGLKDRFFQAATTLDPKRFDVRLFCFDTAIYPTDLQSKKMGGGGGTCFRILEENVQKHIRDEKAKGGRGRYPQAVFVMTDGYGSAVRPEKPEHWHWFISGANAYSLKSIVANYVPKECNVHDLSQFE